MFVFHCIRFQNNDCTFPTTTFLIGNKSNLKTFISTETFLFGQAWFSCGLILD